MKKLILTTLLVVAATAFVACGKKGSGNSNSECNGYPNSVKVTNPTLMQMLYQYAYNVNSYNTNSGYYANNYGNPSYLCVDRNIYNQAYQQVYGYQNQMNPNYCMQYPTASQCQQQAYYPQQQTYYPQQQTYYPQQPNYNNYNNGGFGSGCDSFGYCW